MGIWPVYFAKHAVSSSTFKVSWHPGVFSGPAEMKDVCRVIFEESFVREKVAHTWQRTYRPAVKAKTWKSHSISLFLIDTLAVTSSVNSGCGRPEVVCHLLSSCVHASITSKSGSKVFKLSDKFQKCAIVCEGGERRCLCWRRPWLSFYQRSA